MLDVSSAAPVTAQHNVQGTARIITIPVRQCQLRLEPHTELANDLIVSYALAGFVSELAKARG
jgi:hypothetical protein